MRKKSLECRNVLLVVSLVLATFRVDAQLGIPPLVSALPKEAPSSLFSTSIGDSDVELFVQGFWDASMQSLGSLSFGGSAAAAFNATPFLFTQRPDLYLLMVFRRKWWLEASVADEIERATWAIGYSGEEDDFVKFARLGNTGIMMPAYPYISFGSPAGAFGLVVSGRDESKDTAFDAMLRWDGLSWRSRSFFGPAETVETLIRPGNHLRGRRFVLPQKNLAAIFLYDHTSSSKRLIQTDEFAVSLPRGFIELKTEPKGVLSVVYSVDGVLSDELVLYRRAGTNAALAEGLADINLISEARNLYALSDSPSHRELFVRNLSSGQPDLGFEVNEVGPGLIEVVKAGTIGPPDTEDPSWTPEDYLRPFSAVSGQDWIYDDTPEGNQGRQYPPTEGFSIVARSTETVDAIVLGRETVPGTITVFRDGAQSEAFDFDSTSGRLDLYPPPRSGESILVRFAVTSSDRSDGALVFAAGTRFPWLGLGWALALGGRWSMPGVAYAAGGELKPAWTGLAISMVRREPDFGFGAKAMTKYARASANDLYRLAGMEDSPAFRSPFRPIGGDTEGFDIDTVTDTSLYNDFPKLMGKIHTQNQQNKVLSIKAKLYNGKTGGDIELLRYIEPAPLASFKRLSFFIKAEGLEETSGEVQIRLQLGGGKDGAGGLTLDLTVDDLSQKGWHKVEVDLDPLIPEVRILSALGQSLLLPASLPGGFVPVTTVGELRLAVSGLNSGTVYIDEIIFEDAEDGLSALFSLDFSLGKAAAAQPPYLGIDIIGVVNNTLSLGGSIRTGLFLGPSEWILSMAPVWSRDYSSAAFGYTVAIPSRASATKIIDQYSQNIATHSYSRNLSATSGFGSLRLGVEAGSAEVGNRFSQTWKGSSNLGSLVKVGVELAMVVPESISGVLDPTQVWLESWQYMLPTMEASASSRRMNLTASIIDSRFVMDYRQDFLAPGKMGTNVGARARLPFSVGVLGFETFLERRYKIIEFASSTGFLEDFNFALGRAKSIIKPFSALPFMDLLMKDSMTLFITNVSGSSTASYSTGAGILARRSIGYGLPDLFIPNSMELLWTRIFDAKLDSQVENHDFHLKATTAAVNLFGYGGAKPLVDELAYDEYSSGFEASARYHPVDGALLPSLGVKHGMSVETRQGSTINAVSRFSWKSTRTGSQISEAVSLSVGKKPVRTWLGDVVALILFRRSKMAEQDLESTKNGSGEEKNNSIYRWFDSIAMDSTVLRDSLDTSVTVSRQELPGSGVLKTSLGYATRVIIPGSLSIGFKSSLYQNIGFRTEGWVWGFGYDFAIEGRVSF